MPNSWKRGPGPQAGEIGYVYVSDEEDHPMSEARAGATVELVGRGPPWIVVARDLGSVIVARWPGRLWRVCIVEAATRRDQSRAGGPPGEFAGYTRAISVLVEEEEDPAQLFGPNGRELIPLFDAATRLERSQAELLAGERDPRAPGAIDRAWRQWLERHGSPPDYYEDLSDTLLMGGSAPGSPVGDGFVLLDRTVSDRAKQLEGEAATESDEDDIWLVPPWSHASWALVEAAMALGAPDLVRAEDREPLLRAWLALCGSRSR